MRSIEKAVPNHRPMSPHEAANLLDYSVLLESGSLCEARAAAARTLRSYAHEAVSSTKQSRRRRRQCFKHLGELPVPECTGRDGGIGDASMVGRERLGLPEG